MEETNTVARETYGINLVIGTIEGEFEAFDRLPRWLRDKINDAPYKISCPELRKRIDQGQQFTPLNWPILMASANKKKALAAYGTDHPQAQ